MRKQLPITALVATLAAPMAMAQSSVTIYGVIDLAFTRASNGPANITRVDSGTGWGSRLGFRGSEDLGGGLKANFLLEQGFDASSGALQQGGAAFGRSAWLGLSGSNWETRLGRQLSPTALSLLAVDPGVGNYYANLQQTGIGSLQSPASVAGDPGHQSTARINNSASVRWTEGSWMVRALVAPGQSDSTGAGNLHGGSVTYEKGPLLGTAAYTRFKQYAKDIPSGAAPGWQTEWTLAGSYKFSLAKLEGGFYSFDPSERNKTLAATTVLKSQSRWIGATVPTGTGQVLVQYIRNNVQRMPGVAAANSDILGATYEHFLSKRTVAYASAGSVRNSATSNTMLVGSTTAVVPGAMGASVKAVSFGLRHSF